MEVIVDPFLFLLAFHHKVGLHVIANRCCVVQLNWLRGVVTAPPLPLSDPQTSSVFFHTKGHPRAISFSSPCSSGGVESWDQLRSAQAPPTNLPGCGKSFSIVQCHCQVCQQLCFSVQLERRHQNIVVRPENCLQLWAQKRGCFGHLSREQCQCRLPIQIVNEGQFQRFKLSILQFFLSECCSFTNLRLCKPPHLLLLHYLWEAFIMSCLFLRGLKHPLALHVALTALHVAVVNAKCIAQRCLEMTLNELATWGMHSAAHAPGGERQSSSSRHKLCHREWHDDIWHAHRMAQVYSWVVIMNDNETAMIEQNHWCPSPKVSGLHGFIKLYRQVASPGLLKLSSAGITGDEWWWAVYVP